VVVVLTDDPDPLVPEPLLPELPLGPLIPEPLWRSSPDAPPDEPEEPPSLDDPGPELELESSALVVAVSSPVDEERRSSPRSRLAGAGLGAGELEASETGWAESPIESPEIAFAARAIAPAATMPVMPSRMVSSRSLLVMGSG
jgi:hypothetical protein